MLPGSRASLSRAKCFTSSLTLEYLAISIQTSHLYHGPKIILIVLKYLLLSDLETSVFFLQNSKRYRFIKYSPVTAWYVLRVDDDLIVGWIRNSV